MVIPQGVRMLDCGRYSAEPFRGAPLAASALNSRKPGEGAPRTAEQRAALRVRGKGS